MNAKNHVEVTVAQGYDASATVITLAPGEGVRVPAAPAVGTWWNATDHSNPDGDANVEEVEVVSRDVDNLTILRGQEQAYGSKPASVKNLVGKTYRLRFGLTAGMWESTLKGLKPEALSGNDAFRTAKMTYDFALDGGAIGLVPVTNHVTLPAGAYVTSGYFVPLAPLTSDGATTIGFGIEGQSPSILGGPISFDTFNDLQNNNSSPWWNYIIAKVATPSKVTMTISGAPLTGGRLELHTWYFVGGL